MKKIIMLSMVFIFVTVPMLSAASIEDTGIIVSPRTVEGDWNSGFYQNGDGKVNVGTTNRESDTETVTFKFQDNEYDTWYTETKALASGEEEQTGLVNSWIGSINRGVVDTDNNMTHSPWFNA